MKNIQSLYHIFSGEPTLPPEEYCAKWFRGQARGFSSSEKIEIIRQGFSEEEIHILRTQGYNAKFALTIGTLWETRNHPLFKSLRESCVWLPYLVPDNHHLIKHIGKWCAYPNPKNGEQRFPYRITHLEYNHLGDVVYHCENQLTLPYGRRVEPKLVNIITETQAKKRYLNSIANGHWNNVTEWGNVHRTRLFNPKQVDLTSTFLPELSEATWHIYSKCHQFTIKEGKKNYD